MVVWRLGGGVFEQGSGGGMGEGLGPGERQNQ